VCTFECLSGPKTQANVLGYCPFTKEARIEKHDVVVREDRERLLSAGVNVYHEQTFRRSNSATLRPDIVAIIGGVGHVIDVTIRYEDEEEIGRAFTEKQVKYDDLRGDVLTRHPDLRGFGVVPLAFGSRRAFPRDTRDALALLGFPRDSMIYWASLGTV
jgi:hypothetical protein